MTDRQRLRVMFVDDESRILQGLQRMLRPLRDEWEMMFLESGDAALAEMVRSPVDVVVSDMRMPGMNGAELLGQVMRRYPSTVRIILSGHADRDLVNKTIGKTHQYLNKPCDPDVLKATIDRAAKLRRILTSESLRLLTGRLERLPSLPALYLQLVDLLQSPTTTIGAIASLISKDLGMSLKILQLVNSAFFGTRRSVSTLEEAVNLLGIETIQSLVLSLHAFDQLPAMALPGFSFDAIWYHSVAVSSLARAVARSEGADRLEADEAFLAGMLHDIGRVILATNLPDEYNTVIAQVRESGRSLIICEREILGASHADVGAYLLGLWGIADPIVEAVAYHHTPRDRPGRAFGSLAAVHIADALHHGVSSSLHCGSIEAEFLQELGIAHRVLVWIQMAEANQQHGDPSYA